MEVTAQVFFRLIRTADEMPQFSDLAALVKAAGRTAKCNIPPRASSSRPIAAHPRGERRVQQPDGCCSKDAVDTDGFDSYQGIRINASGVAFEVLTTSGT